MLIDKESLISEAIRLKHDVVDLSTELLQVLSTLNKPLTLTGTSFNPLNLIGTRGRCRPQYRIASGAFWNNISNLNP